MNRIEKTFEGLRAKGEKALVGYLTAGDPDLQGSEAGIRSVLDNGVDIIELGIPFSDPTADGPTIQAAAHRALAAGVNLEKVFELVSRLRQDYEQPIILFGYANPLLRYGYARACAAAADAGADGFLVVDLPFEEKHELTSHMGKVGLEFIPLISPTTTKERASQLLSDAGGFVYYIMVKGVTGARTGVVEDVGAHVSALRECTRLPIAVGFGVSTGEQAREVGRLADGVVVGSALIQARERGDLADLVRELKQALQPTGAGGL